MMEDARSTLPYHRASQLEEQPPKGYQADRLSTSPNTATSAVDTSITSIISNHIEPTESTVYLPRSNTVMKKSQLAATPHPSTRKSIAVPPTSPEKVPECKVRLQGLFDAFIKQIPTGMHRFFTVLI